MTAAEYLKSIAGRWQAHKEASLTRQYDMAVTFELAAAEVDGPIVYDPGSAEDGTGIWLPAGVVRPGDQVNVHGEWLTVNGTRVYGPTDERERTVNLHYASLRVAATFRLPFTSRVYVRDVAAIIGDELKGVSM